MVADILGQRETLAEMLQSLPIVVKIHPTDANFLLVQFEDAKAVMDYLIRETIIVRDRSRVHLCEGCLRITVGTKEENEVLIESLKKFQPRNVIA
jgi:histidinol-phosphate aminotransferase